MIGIVLGSAMLVSSMGVAPLPAVSQQAVAPVVFNFELPASATVDRPVVRRTPVRSAQATPTKRHSTTDKVIAIAAGTALGFWAGGAAGYYATQDRDKDDDGTSGLKGVVIGAPIGAAVGALIGWRLTRN